MILSLILVSIRILFLIPDEVDFGVGQTGIDSGQTLFESVQAQTDSEQTHFDSGQTQFDSGQTPLDMGTIIGSLIVILILIMNALI